MALRQLLHLRLFCPPHCQYHPLRRMLREFWQGIETVL
jgi:hypothetical protein